MSSVDGRSDPGGDSSSGALIYAAGILVASIVGQVLCAQVLAAAIGVDLVGAEEGDLPGWLLAWPTAIVYGALIALVAVEARSRPGGLLGLARPGPRAFAWAVAVGALGFGLNVLWVNLLPVGLEGTTLFQAMRSPADLVAMGVVVVLAAPAFEEMLFRGLFYDALVGRGVGFAVVVTTTLFTVPHLATYHEAPLALAPIAVLGVALGGLRAASGSFLPCVVAHAVFNSLSFLGWFPGQ